MLTIAKECFVDILVLPPYCTHRLNHSMSLVCIRFPYILSASSKSVAARRSWKNCYNSRNWNPIRGSLFKGSHNGNHIHFKNFSTPAFLLQLTVRVVRKTYLWKTTVASSWITKPLQIVPQINGRLQNWKKGVGLQLTMEKTFFLAWS